MFQVFDVAICFCFSESCKLVHQALLSQVEDSPGPCEGAAGFLFVTRLCLFFSFVL